MMAARWSGLLAAVVWTSATSFAQGLVPSSASLQGATLERPAVLMEGGAMSFSPLWAGEVLFATPPADLPALVRMEHHGPPVWDPSSGAWYAWGNGALVRLAGESALVVLEGPLGRDLDVRAADGVAVSREPDHTIVRWGLEDGSRRVLLRGPGYFRPRFSHDGSLVLVQESREGGGRMWLVSREGTVHDLGPGSDGTFTPDGLGVVFTMVVHDGHRIVDADLYYLDLPSGRRTRLTRTRGVAEVEPAVSPDGRFIAFVDAHTGRLCVAPMPGAAGGGSAP